MREIVMLLLAVVISIVTHEIGHILGYLLFQTPVNLIYLPGFMIERSDSGIKINKIPMYNKIFMVPKVDLLEDETDYLQYRKSIIGGIAGGVVATVFMLFIAVILAVQEPFYAYGRVLFITNLLLFFTLLINRPQSIGDARAVKYLTKDPQFFDSYLFSWLILSEKNLIDINEDSYLFRRLMHNLDERNTKKNIEFLYYLLIIINYKACWKQETYEMVNEILDRNISDVMKTENKYLILQANIFYLFDQKINFKEVIIEKEYEGAKSYSLISKKIVLNYEKRKLNGENVRSKGLGKVV